MLVSVFDALALIRLRRTLFANFGCELTYLLLVGTGNYDFIGCRYLYCDTVNLGNDYLM